MYLVFFLQHFQKLQYDEYVEHKNIFIFVQVGAISRHILDFYAFLDAPVAADVKNEASSAAEIPNAR
jgi:hypothetical protein